MRVRLSQGDRNRRLVIDILDNVIVKIEIEIKNMDCSENK